MKTRFFGILIAVGSLLVSGCGLTLVARSRPKTPAYCSDCHRGAHWHKTYTECAHYQIVVVHDGYRYRPRHHAKHQEYKSAKFEHSSDKEKKEKSKKGSREQNDKEKRSRD